MSRARAEKTTELACSVEDLWPLITDTDRINRLLGLAPVTYTPIAEDAKNASRFLAETRFAGLRVVYEESPFEWVHLERFGVFRRCVAGPLASISILCALQRIDEKPGASRLRVTVEIEPKYTFFAPFAWLGARATTAKIIALGRALDRHLSATEPAPFDHPAATADRDETAFALSRLVDLGVGRPLAIKLADYVSSCSDFEAERIRPYQLADTWGLPRREVLSALLHGVTSGLVDLQWRLLCPSCRSGTEKIGDGEPLPDGGHCQMCDISIDLALDQTVEAVFTPNVVIRPISDAVFCLAGPARTPHVLIQATIEPLSQRTVTVPLGPGRYRVFARGGGRAMLTIDEGLEDSAKLSVEPERLLPATLSIRPGGALVVDNVTDEGRHLKVEHLEYASASASAHDVSLLAEHHGRFGTSLIKPKTAIKVGRVALLFSDLSGSTALYANVGDASAFRLVDDHFDVLRAVIVAHEGRIVKTMGDAIMASFVSDADCARAAVACLRRFEEFRATQPNGDRVALKLGFFGGPCFVNQANGVLDYFGQTVNIAARLQHEAAGGELVMPQGADVALADDDIAISAPTRVSVKGVPDPLAIVRVRLKA